VGGPVAVTTTEYTPGGAVGETMKEVIVKLPPVPVLFRMMKQFEYEPENSVAGEIVHGPTSSGEK
jgi:hypothetical protein